MILTLKFILAHLLGDFVFQPSKWVKHKRTHTYRSAYLYLHLFIHLSLLLVIVGNPLYYWVGILVTVLSHFLIDLSKLSLHNQLNERTLFFLDQIAHFSIIAWVIHRYEPYQLDLNFLLTPQLLLFTISILLVTIISAVLMRIILSQWTVNEDFSRDSLDNAGKYIGILERLFIFFFVVMEYWQPIGFLLAAKSVFRFGDLSKAKDRKLTEYILIGTFLSFGLAIVAGLLYKYFLQCIN